jgi:replicative DNA helicase
MKSKFEPQLIKVKLEGILPVCSDYYEKQVLGSMLQNENVVKALEDFLKPTDFFYDPHKKICEALIHLSREGLDIDALTVTAWLEERKISDMCGGISYLVDLGNECTYPTKFMEFAGIVKEKSDLRKMQTFCQVTLCDIMENEHEAEDVLNRAATAFSKAQERETTSKTKTSKEVGTEFLREVLQAQDRRASGKNASDIMLGIPSVDNATGGCLPGEMIVVAARSGEGKSVVGVHAKRANGKAGHPTGIINLEMKASRYRARAVAAECGIDTSKMRDGLLSNSELLTVQRWEDELESWPLFYETITDLSSSQFRGVARKLVSKHGVKVIILDYIQLMTDDDENGNREQEVSKISRTIKQMAIELNIPIIVLAQLNRQATGEPTIHHLRESGAITQDADKIILLHRHDVTDTCVNNDHYPTKVILGKQRDGRIGSTEYILEGKFCRFSLAHEVQGYVFPERTAK